MTNATPSQRQIKPKEVTYQQFAETYSFNIYRSPFFYKKKQCNIQPFQLMYFYVHQLKQCFLSEVHLNQNNPLPGSAALSIWQMSTIAVMNQDVSPFFRGHCSSSFFYTVDVHEKIKSNNQYSDYFTLKRTKKKKKVLKMIHRKHLLLLERLIVLVFKGNEEGWKSQSKNKAS